MLALHGLLKSRNQIEAGCPAPLPYLCYITGMNETLTIRLGEELASALAEESRRTGLTKGEIARRAIESRLHSAGRVSVMEKHFGTVNGPADLSSNKSYRRLWKRKSR